MHEKATLMTIKDVFFKQRSLMIKNHSPLPSESSTDTSSLKAAHSFIPSSSRDLKDNCSNSRYCLITGVSPTFWNGSFEVESSPVNVLMVLFSV